ncbi:hypothetical protein SNOG_01028 [Parastagonospora nodorum SN15]|uniref:Uncharacterized protein n=1 Tax=Phaeosphaeria nodorum (strain SN15 / ATCC MYA-4574 / FGSC 10173) TaxID=321614 RepID=Q0V4N6_PHANO|nr:hypothetical protein SNOG_01028 [Parastagonospora nodorum SN15]EAT92523.1 hypothetical protein SNOG_01028 [Parastagonospora nodorum SN15]
MYTIVTSPRESLDREGVHFARHALLPLTAVNIHSSLRRLSLANAKPESPVAYP